MELSQAKIKEFHKRGYIVLENIYNLHVNDLIRDCDECVKLTVKRDASIVNL